MIADLLKHLWYHGDGRQFTCILCLWFYYLFGAAENCQKCQNCWDKIHSINKIIAIFILLVSSIFAVILCGKKHAETTNWCFIKSLKPPHLATSNVLLKKIIHYLNPPFYLFEIHL